MNEIDILYQLYDLSCSSINERRVVQTMACHLFYSRATCPLQMTHNVQVAVLKVFPLSNSGSFKPSQYCSFLSRVSSMKSLT